MERKIIYTACCLLLLGTSAFSQEKRSIKKEVNVENVNGERTVTITTTEKGKVNTQVFTGAEADAFLAQEEQNMPKEGVVVEKEIVEDDGTNKATVRRYKYKSTGASDEDIIVSDNDEGYTTEALTIIPDPENNMMEVLYELPKKEDGIITVMNSFDQEVYQTRVSGAGQQKLQVPLGDSGSGSYTVKLEQEGIMIVKKLVIE